MRRLLTAFVVPILGLFLLIGCKEVKPTSVPEEESVDSVMEEEVIADSTIYGVCGDGTAMHTLELITDGGDTLSYAMMVEEDADVQGGLLVGDRMAVIGKNTADGLVANWHIFVDAETLENECHAVTLEDTHKIIFTRNEELSCTRIALAATTTTELVINTT